MMNKIQTLKQEMENELNGNILHFWLARMIDRENGGFHGRIDGEGRLVAGAEKGAILNARILWSFSAAYRVTGKEEYKEAADRAAQYLMANFVDYEYGGVYWSLHDDGKPKDTKKQTYAIGFAIYGLAEYVRATGSDDALKCAIGLYHDIEAHAFDTVNNGYTEALSRDWKPIADMRLSDKDENGSKTMNTHLHIIEPYTNLYRVWKNEGLRGKLVNLLHLFLDVMLNPQTNHLDLFFNDQWQGSRNIQSFGHDIEASWLLHETALVLADPAILKAVEPKVKAIAVAADEGLCDNGGMIYERWTDTGHTDRQFQWWVQCENIIGHVNLYQHFGDEPALEQALKSWRFVKENIIDKDKGEWLWGLNADGTPDREDDKAGFWKCPYHNSRMCLELMERDF